MSAYFKREVSRGLKEGQGLLPKHPKAAEASDQKINIV